MRRSIAQDDAFPTRGAGLPSLAGALALCVAVLGACAGPDATKHDAASPATSTGGGGGTLSSAGGSVGQTTPEGSGGASGGSGGNLTGTGGDSGRGGGSGSGRDAGAGGAGARDASTGGDAAGSSGAVDGGAAACDDITSPGRLAVYYYSNSGASGSSIQMYFDLVNFTAFSSRLSQVTVRYWFTDENASAANVLEQYYVPLATNMKFITLSPARIGADTVLEISYTAAGDAGGSFVETRGFNFAFHKNNYSGNYDQTNDYSYDPTLKSTLGQNPHITAYINGELAWGCEPPAK